MKTLEKLEDMSKMIEKLKVSDRYEEMTDQISYKEHYFKDQDFKRAVLVNNRVAEVNEKIVVTYDRKLPIVNECYFDSDNFNKVKREIISQIDKEGNVIKRRFVEKRPVMLGFIARYSIFIVSIGYGV